jgi:uncharacterized phage protein (TIGR02220 family)
MIINVDLAKLKLIGINLNEYFTLYKIWGLSNGESIPFNSTDKDLASLSNKDFITFDKESVSLTSKCDKLFHRNMRDKITSIIDYFKETTGKTKTDSFSISNRRFVKDRLDQGYTEDDLKAVINLKYNEWKDSSMAKYIRLETLFNQTKFQIYIGEVEAKKNTTPVNSNIKRI